MAEGPKPRIDDSLSCAHSGGGGRTNTVQAKNNLEMGDGGGNAAKLIF